jgi:sugar phosphate isomerase/epimerase
MAASASPSALTSFKLGAISDGFSDNFGEALRIMKSYGLSWVEIRQVFGVYNTEATPKQIRLMKELVSQNGFKVSVIDSALYKCTLPGTTPSVKERDSYPYDAQMELLKRACERGHALDATKIRGFTFWRVAEPEGLTERIADELNKAAEVARQEGMRLVIENEETCNAATGQELARVLAKAPAANLGANWDVGNGYLQGEKSFPNGYKALDKSRIWHVHLKGMRCLPGLRSCHEAIAGQGENDLTGQLRQFLRDGYQGTMSLECEFQAPGMSHVETTRRSMEGLLKAAKEAVADR